MRVLVTGANGFIGSAVTFYLSQNNIEVVAATRKPSSIFAGNNKIISKTFGNLTNNTDWENALSGVDIVVHTAARVHIMNDGAKNPLEEFRKSNVLGTANLAEQAAKSGVKRFIFISSIKVNGENTELGKPFTAEDTPAPEDYYGISKLEAEQELQKIAKNTGMELVIIRPPMVYGKGAKGNVTFISKLIKTGIPLPLASIKNLRSFVAIDNLVDLIYLCLTHKSAADQTFLVSDGKDLTTADLFRNIAQSENMKLRLIPFPEKILKKLLHLLGKKEFAKRICDSLQIDITKTKNILGWNPPFKILEEIRRK